MSRDGRYVASSQGWRCDECPGMDGMWQGARDGDVTNANTKNIFSANKRKLELHILS